MIFKEENKMAVNLSKGQRVSLDKSVTLARIGLGWDTNRYDGGSDFDLDASVFLLGANGKVLRDEDFVFYNNLNGRNGAVVHTGDNRTGEGDGDDEAISSTSRRSLPGDREDRSYRNDFRRTAAQPELRSGIQRVRKSS